MGYIDPGAFGLISQIGYILLFAIVSGFMFFFKPIKTWLNKLFRRRQSAAQQEEIGKSAKP